MAPGFKGYSIESSSEWTRQLRLRTATPAAEGGVIGRAEATGQLELITVDVGRTGKWGVPTATNPEDISALGVRYAGIISRLGPARRPSFRRTLSRDLTNGREHNHTHGDPTELRGDDERPSWPARRGHFDLALVDGRWRVACALHAWPVLDTSDGVLLVHDWTAQRPRMYKAIRSFFALDHLNQTLASWRKDAAIRVTPAELQTAREKAQRTWNR